MKKRNKPAWNKIVWTQEQMDMMREKWDSMTNADLARLMNVKVTSLRMKLYSMGLYKMRMEYWTDEQVEFLKENYCECGDTELAAMFAERWPKNKGWSKKHIEKKRRYLKLKRTEEQKRYIHRKLVATGLFKGVVKRMWEKRGVAAEGDVRLWRKKDGHVIPMVKVGGRFVCWARHTWEQANGKIEKGMNLVFSNNDQTDLRLENLQLISDAELAKRNTEVSSKGLSDNYVAAMIGFRNPGMKQIALENPKLIALKRNILLTKRVIKNERVINE